MKKKLVLKKETVSALKDYKGGIVAGTLRDCYTVPENCTQHTEFCPAQTAETCNGASCQPTLCLISRNPADSCLVYCPGTADCLTKGNMCAN